MPVATTLLRIPHLPPAIGWRVWRDFALLVACGIGAVAPAAAQAPAVRMCYDDTDAFPWLLKDRHGLNNLLVELTAKHVGVTVEQLPLPWKRCLYSLKTGTVDAVIAASHTPERATFAVYPLTANGNPDAGRRTHFDSYSFYQLRGATSRWDGRQLGAYTGAVGIQLGYSVRDELRRMGLTVDEASDRARVLMQRLVTGQLGLIALLTQEGDRLLADAEFAGKIEKLTPPIVEKPYFVIFGKAYAAKNPAQVDSFWTALAAVRESRAYRVARQRVALASRR